MSNLQQMGRVLYRHDWTDVEDWAAMVARLADLNDDEIALIEHYGRFEVESTPDASRRTRAAPSPRRSLATRAREFCATLAASFRDNHRRVC